MDGEWQVELQPLMTVDPRAAGRSSSHYDSPNPVSAVQSVASYVPAAVSREEYPTLPSNQASGVRVDGRVALRKAPGKQSKAQGGDTRASTGGAAFRDALDPPLSLAARLHG